MGISSFLVTLRAIASFLAKARAAQADLDKANAAMKAAAEELCGKWKGDASAAFAKEQGVLFQWCSELSSIGSEYMDTVAKVSQAYQEAEEAVSNAIKG